MKNASVGNMVHIFPHKKGRVGKIGSCLKKQKEEGGRGGGYSVTYFYVN